MADLQLHPIGRIAAPHATPRGRFFGLTDWWNPEMQQLGAQKFTPSRQAAGSRCSGADARLQALEWLPTKTDGAEREAVEAAIAEDRRLAEEAAEAQRAEEAQRVRAAEERSGVRPRQQRRRVCALPRRRRAAPARSRSVADEFAALSTALVEELVADDEAACARPRNRGTAAAAPSARRGDIAAGR